MRQHQVNWEKIDALLDAGTDPKVVIRQVLGTYVEAIHELRALLADAQQIEHKALALEQEAQRLAQLLILSQQDIQDLVLRQEQDRTRLAELKHELGNLRARQEEMLY
jgi:hypothetical protein